MVVRLDKEVLKILKNIEDSGFEAYIVGGYVRDYILKISSNDIDIATNALLKDLKSLFPQGRCSDKNYGSFRIQTKKHNFDISTYREEMKYNNRRPTEIKYVNNLLTDIMRRDFTINSLCMNRNKQIIDLLNGKEDIFNKKIKVIGDVNQKFSEDPLRMLRALRFSIVLEFTIESEALQYIINHKSLLESLSYQRKKNELDLILLSNNSVKGMEYLKKIGILEVLEINYQNLKKVDNLLGMWSQISISSKYPFTKIEQSTINNIKKIVEYGKIDLNILFKYQIYDVLVAGELLEISKKDIYNLYNKMSIHTYKEIKISNKDIIHLLNVKPSSLLKVIMDDVKDAILNGKLSNRKSNIKKYLISNKEVWKIE